MSLFHRPLLTLLTLAAPAAFATNLFTVDVSVEVNRALAEVAEIRTQCRLSGRDPVTRAPGQWGPTKVQTFVPDASGNLRTEVSNVWTEADFTATQRDNLNLVYNTTCELWFRIGSSWYINYDGAVRGPGVTPRPGTPFRMVSSAAIP